jgi:NhaP-type Na+/H+ or K+/H+ antiporter
MTEKHKAYIWRRFKDLLAKMMSIKFVIVILSTIVFFVLVGLQIEYSKELQFPITAGLVFLATIYTGFLGTRALQNSKELDISKIVSPNPIEQDPSKKLDKNK